MNSDRDAPGPRIHGVVAGVVTDAKDPEQLARVKVTFVFSGRTESAWARVVVPSAGDQMGTYFFPMKDDEVLVAFRDGDLGHPYVLGYLWSAPNPPSRGARPPVPSPQLRRSEIRSRSRHVIAFDDTDGDPSLSLTTKGGHTIVLHDEPTKVVRIRDSGGHLSVALDTDKGTITLATTGTPTGASISLDTNGKVTIEGSSIELSAPRGTVRLRGRSVDISGPQRVSINDPGGS
jgi:uncharacterized protein involved in type VI secretion and phage assembly